MLSKHFKNIANKYDIKICGVNKVVPNWGNKSKNVLHYRNLQLYLSLGMKLIQVYRVSKFKQSHLWKKYTDLNTEKMLSIVLKNIFLNWWIMVFMAKQWKIWGVRL